jgi:hypothetical protein
MTNDDAPDKIRLVPDGYHVDDVGRLGDGRQYFVSIQLNFSGGETRDFVCTFLFDNDGKLVSHTIDLVGVRGAYDKAAVTELYTRHLAALGERTVEEVWLRPFSVTSHGLAFGLIANYDDESGWRVEFMPGNTMSFYPPWDSGEYDT